ncbi:MAG: MBG domain-containing protein [Cyclobacteriaceae bacterium]|nr:MBG domain-containing protein [Cyclobacteriaceae bacterium]
MEDSVHRSTIKKQGEDVGEYAVAIGDLSAGSNYTTTLSGGGIFTITPASLTVTVVPGQSKVYSEDDPILEYTSIGLVGEDSFTGALSREQGEDVGEYAVTIGDLSAGSNYTTTLSGGGIFAITPAALTVTVVPGTIKGVWRRRSDIGLHYCWIGWRG